MNDEEYYDFIRYKYQQIVGGLTWEQIDNIPRYEIELTIALHNLEKERSDKQGENQLNSILKSHE